MKVGLFSDTYLPQINGVATSVRMLKESLIAEGHEVYVFTTTNPGAAENETNVYRMPSMPFVSANRLGMFYHPQIARTVKELDLDIIHTHTEFSLGMFGRHLAKGLNIPLVHTMHTKYEDYTHHLVKLNVLSPMAKSAARKLSSAFCNCADEVIAPTGKVRNMLLDYGVRREISIVPTGIELEKFRSSCARNGRCVRSELGLNSDDKVILYVGRISEEKNIDEILIALKGYLPTRDNIKFVLVGDGPDRERLEEMSYELGINSQTIFAGGKKWDEIGAYYQMGDVFVSASQSETQGLTYIEALAAGVPVVAKDDPCLDGVVENGINGFKFGCQDDFIPSLDKVLSQKLLRDNLSEGALDTSARYSASGYAQSVLSVYSNAIWQTAPIYAS